jgi:altronate dehydratase
MIADEIRASGKPVAHLVIQDNHGSQQTTREALEKARELLALAEAVPVSAAPFERLTVGVHFDTRSQEANRIAHAAFLPVADWLVRRGSSVLVSERLRRSERSTATDAGLLEFGRKPDKPGLAILDTPDNGVQALTGMAASGAQLIIQLSERGAPGGVPVAPVLKVSTSSQTFSLLEDDLDLDAGPIAAGSDSDAVSRRLIRMIECVARGERTKAERQALADPIGILTEGPAF